MTLVEAANAINEILGYHHYEGSWCSDDLDFNECECWDKVLAILAEIQKGE